MKTDGRTDTDFVIDLNRTFILRPWMDVPSTSVAKPFDEKALMSSSLPHLFK